MTRLFTPSTVYTQVQFALRKRLVRLLSGLPPALVVDLIPDLTAIRLGVMTSECLDRDRTGLSCHIYIER